MSSFWEGKTASREWKQQRGTENMKRLGIESPPPLQGEERKKHLAQLSADSNKKSEELKRVRAMFRRKALNKAKQ